MFEGTRWIFKSRKLKEDIQYNDQKDKQLTTKHYTEN